MNRLSQAELEIMNIIWHNPQPISISEIILGMDTGKRRKYTTIATFVNRLKDKGFLECEKIGNANEYYALITEEEFRREQTAEFVDSIYSGSSKSLIASLCADKLSESDFKELMDWIEGRDI